MTTTSRASKAPKKGAKKEVNEIKLSKQWDLKFIPRNFEFNHEQKVIFKTMADKDTKIVFLSGVAGTAKSYTAIYAALREMQNDHDKSIIYLRSVVESSSRSMGFLPGELEEKLSPYLQPLEDKLMEMIPPQDMVYLKEAGRIQAMPINFLRGASWTNKIVVVDEAQNMTQKELITILTRVGEGTKLFILGDPMQADIRDSGFAKIVDAFSDVESYKHGVSVFRLETQNVVRSEIVKYVLKKTQNLDSK